VTVTNPVSSEKVTELAPSYRIPLTLIVAALPLVIAQPFVGVPVELFGLFLLLQTVTLRLLFTETALDVYRSETLIRRFPYAEWQNWEIFWEKVPILFYFKEVKSIHFLPIIFDPKALRSCLETHCPRNCGS
jgi:hypothetical protein